MSDWLVRWTQTNGTVETISVLSMRVTLNKDAKTNSAELILPKRGNIVDGNIRFIPGQVIQIYAKNGLITTPDVADLIMTCKILNLDLNPDDNTIKLTCSDYTYDLLSTLFTRDITQSLSLNSSEIVSKIVQENASAGITQNTLSTNIVTTNHLGGAFPNVDFVSVWKTSFDCISELSQPQYTADDRTYLFWFDPDGTFNWTYPTNTVESLELEFGTMQIISLDHSRAEAETINMIIYDAGTDLNDDPILDFELRANAGSIKGSTRYLPMTKIAPELKRSWGGTDNAEFVAAVKKQAIAKCAAIFTKTGEGLNQATVNIRGQKVNLAKLYGVKSDMKSRETLRLDRVVHTMSRMGWQTRLELQTDPTELTTP